MRRKWCDWACCGGARRVSWHACHSWQAPVTDAAACWVEALVNGAPPPAEHVGDFAPVDAWTGSVWRLRDPEATLEEEWERIEDGDGRFFAARRGSALLCVAGDYFGFVNDDGERAPNACGAWYASGRVQAVLVDDGSEAILKPAWRVEMSTDPKRCGGTLALEFACGSKDEWTALPGCTVSWDELHDHN